MFTRCPECQTFFRVTAENLRVANGEVCCGSCETEFNALTSLTDVIPDLLKEDNPRGTVPDLLKEDNRRGVIPGFSDEDNRRNEVPELSDEDNHRDKVPDLSDGDNHRDEAPAGIHRLEHEMWNQEEWQALLSHAEAPAVVEDQDEVDSIADAPDSNLYGEIIVLESGPDNDELDSSEDDTADRETDYDSEPDEEEEYDEDLEESDFVVAAQTQDIEREFEKIGAEEPAENSESFHRWLNDDPDAGDELETEPAPTSRGWLVAATILMLILFGQLLHYNRDSLAAHPKYGSTIRGLYSGLGLALYPDWELKSFEVRGTEAVTGDAEWSALNILANVLVVGDQPVGMPVIRVVLHDRWSDPVASGIFEPGEYLNAGAARPRILEPGTTLPIKISVADPGSEARGYVVDICLPRRSTGLQCQLAKDPFRK
jgi:predicted Zn finger-like uncharacterized protein